MSIPSILECEGTVDLGQFWPQGHKGNKKGSDADTINLQVGSKGFFFQGKKTAVFQGAYVNQAKRKGKMVPNPVLQKGNTIQVRLQGIDAPELHYPTTVKGKKNGDFRQFSGRTAVQRLWQSLNPAGKGKLKGRFFTRVQKPGEVCDKYGRFVGDIEVFKNGKRVNFNQWLLQEGWVIPSFYESMSNPEIEALKVIWKKGSKKPKRVGQYLQKKLGAFQNLQFADPIRPDKGTLVNPKLFRRQAAQWVTNNWNPFSVSQFTSFLKKNKSDRAYRTEEFIKKGKKAVKFHLATIINSKGGIKFKPHEVVFTEAPASLKGKNGERVTQW